jgi:enamine deaminase RidA (YjgF/YER057c/UK114 family)
MRYKGKIGRDLTVDQGYEAARMCGLNLIAQVRSACNGDLDRVKRVVKLGAFVNCIEDFKEHPNVVNGASDLMVEVFGDAGRCTRINAGVPSLPLGFAVEIDGVFEIE